MKYFLHDTNSFNDEKISELYMQFGYEGIGLFYTILEKIASQEKPIKTDVLKHQLNVGKRLDKCWSFMEEIGIISSTNGETFNVRLLSYSEKYQIKKEKNRKKISEHRENQYVEKNVTRYNDNCIPDKVKESKVNKSKVKESIYPTLTEVISYFSENGYSQKSAEKAFRYYSDADWVDGQGKKVRNWKQKMQAVWFKDENKAVDKSFISINDVENAIKAIEQAQLRDSSGSGM